MSIETQRLRMLSEWRTILVSQTCYPIMYQVEQPPKSVSKPRWAAEKYVAVQIPIGNRIITKWQEQVRPMGSSDDRWYVIREWTEAEM